MQSLPGRDGTRLLLFILMLLLLSAIVWRYRDTSDEEVERAFEQQSQQLLRQAEKAGEAARKTLRETAASLDKRASDLEARTRHLRTGASGFVREGTKELRKRIEQVSERAARLHQQTQQVGAVSAGNLDEEARELQAEVERLTKEVEQALADSEHETNR